MDGERDAGGGQGEPRTIKRKFVRVRRAKFDRLEAPPPEKPKGEEFPYLARMLALAHALERRIEAAEVDGRQALARKLGVSPARLAPILDLTLLAPDIQREILWSQVGSPVGMLSLRAVRTITLERSWTIQRRRWAEARAGLLTQ